MGGVSLSKDAHGNGHDQVSMVKSLHISNRPLKKSHFGIKFVPCDSFFPVGLVQNKLELALQLEWEKCLPSTKIL